MFKIFCKPLNRKKIIAGCIVAAALASRFFFLDARPLHHDEGVNYFFASQIIKEGKFSYDPVNYHGPFYFFSLFLSFLVFGISEFSLRFPAAFFGALLILFPLIFRQLFKPASTISSILILFSPSILYFSRYSIHEISLVLASVAAIYVFSLILEKKDIIYLPFFALSLGVLVAIKETSILILAIFALACLLHFRRLKELKWRENFHIVLASASLFFFVSLALYTGFFTNLSGIYESFSGLAPWLKRGFQETGHFKKTSYYMLLILRYELPLLIFGIYGLWQARKKILFQIFGIWFLTGILAYSLIKYKMPWIVINITTPLAFLAGLGLKELPISKKLRATAIFASTLFLAYFSIETSFITPWQKNNPYAYVHTNMDALSLVKKVSELAQKQKDILIVSDVYWPLPFYLRDEKPQYVSPDEFLGYDTYPNYDIFIVENSAFNRVELLENFTSEKYILRDGAELYLIYK